MKPRARVVGLALVVVAFLAGVAWMRRTPSGPVTPSGTAPRATGWESVEVVGGLEHPWSIAWLPTGELLVTERPGRVRLVRNGTLVQAPLTGVPPVLAKKQAGLMEVSLHPRFSENRWVYLTYSGGTEEANATHLARGRLSPDLSGLTDVTTLLTIRPLKSGLQHFGSRILWLPDGTMLLAVGDGGNPPVRIEGQLAREQAQKLDSQLGKILRLTDEGRAPSDNPFVGKSGVDPLIWSYGHRNLQGLARDPNTDRIWASEHGSRGGDELNRIEPGINYGWPRATYSIEYTFGTISQHTSLPGMADPLVVWTPAQAPSGLLFYTGDAYPAWRGSLFSGALVRKEVRRIELDATGRPIGQQSLPIRARVRDVRQGPDGHLYLLTDEAKGRLLRLQPTP